MLISLCDVFFVPFPEVPLPLLLLCSPNAAALAGVAAPMHRNKMAWKSLECCLVACLGYFTEYFVFFATSSLTFAFAICCLK